MKKYFAFREGSLGVLPMTYSIFIQPSIYQIEELETFNRNPVLQTGGGSKW